MAIGTIECIFFTVVHAGWPSLAYVYQSEGLFSSNCNHGNQTNGNQTEECPDDGGFYFSLTYSVAVVAQTISFFPIGIFFDKFGILKTRLMGT